MDKLVFLSGSLQGATAELIGEEITIGRGTDNAICIDDESISEHHAVIQRRDKECILRDLQSSEGTIVRGGRIIMMALENGDKISFGTVEAQFETTEIKLHIPGNAVLPSVAQSPTWPQRRVAKTNSERSALKSVISTLLQLFALLLFAGGSYWVYQRLKTVDLFGDAAQPERAVSAPLSKPSSAPAQTSKPVQTAAPDRDIASTSPKTQSEPVKSAAQPAAPTPPPPVGPAASQPVVATATPPPNAAELANAIATRTAWVANRDSAQTQLDSKQQLLDSFNKNLEKRRKVVNKQKMVISASGKTHYVTDTSAQQDVNDLTLKIMTVNKEINGLQSYLYTASQLYAHEW